MVVTKDVEVVLATYNPNNHYLAMQIRSIYKQSTRPWRLTIADDCSIDSPSDLFHSLLEEYGDWIRVHEVSTCNNDTIRTFERLLENIQSPYVALCDQDDIWMHNKIEFLLERVCLFKDTPVLVATDALLIDDKGRTIGKTLFQANNIDIKKFKQSDLIVRNVAAGCTMLLSKELVEKALPFPPETIMHDWWLALTASHFGTLSISGDILTKYRQHSSNQVGASPNPTAQILKAFLSLFSKKNPKILLQRALAQSAAFQKRYHLIHEDLSYLAKVGLKTRLRLLKDLILSSRCPSKGTLYKDICMWAMLLYID